MAIHESADTSYEFTNAEATVLLMCVGHTAQEYDNINLDSVLKKLTERVRLIDMGEVVATSDVELIRKNHVSSTS